MTPPPRKPIFPLPFSGVPNTKRGEQNQNCHQQRATKIKSGCLTPAFLGAQKRVEMLRHRCILGDPQQRGTKSEVATSTLPSRGPSRGQKSYVSPAFSKIPDKRNKIRSGYLTPAFSAAQKCAEMLHHPCIPGVPNKGEQNQKWSPKKGNKIRSGTAHNPYKWHTHWKCTPTRSIRSPFAPFMLNLDIGRSIAADKSEA